MSAPVDCNITDGSQVPSVCAPVWLNTVIPVAMVMSMGMIVVVFAILRRDTKYRRSKEESWKEKKRGILRTISSPGRSVRVKFGKLFSKSRDRKGQPMTHVMEASDQPVTFDTLNDTVIFS